MFPRLPILARCASMLASLAPFPPPRRSKSNDHQSIRLLQETDTRSKDLRDRDDKRTRRKKKDEKIP